MYLKEIAVCLVSLTILMPREVLAVENSHSCARPSFLASRDFSWGALAEPENLFWPAYFWYWNGAAEPEVLRQQLGDMAAHDARGVCVLPLPREFRPDRTNSQLDVDYLSREFFDRVKIAVEEAARLGMNYWLYDEGGWPSGQAAGRVVQARPQSVGRLLVCDAEGKWTPATGGCVDYLDPSTTESFIATTHQRYAEAVGSHFGRTIKLVFTDEPAYANPAPGDRVPWTAGADDLFRRRFGYSVLDKLDAFRVTGPQALSPDQKKVRVDLYDFWSQRFRDAYFLPLRDWSRQHGLAHGGHLEGEDETFGAIRYGTGHMTRLLRAMDVPGTDTIWRQLWPGANNHHFPKFASSAARQNGTALVLTESFGVYGNGLTPAEMKWLIDYQYVRGITLFVGCGYPLSTRDHLMSGERPHMSPVNPLWDFLPPWHRYVARLGYVLSCGEPAVETALYYPVRDIWASGSPEAAAADAALRGHDALARALSARQCDYDVIDDDVLSDPSTRVEDGRLVVGPMRYRTVVVGPTQWMTQASRKCLGALRSAGGQVILAETLDQIDAAISKITPTIQANPPSADLRVSVRRWTGGGAAFLFNEGQGDYRGRVTIGIDGKLREIEPATGAVRAVRVVDRTEGRSTIGIDLAAGESMLLVSCSREDTADALLPAACWDGPAITLSDGWTARVDRQYVAGEHDFEIRPADKTDFRSASLGRWAATLGLGEDFSGHVTYRRTVAVPKSLKGGRLLLDLGPVEYAARVLVDGREVGCVLWSPWRIELPPVGDRGEFLLEIQISNTLANELTSERVKEAWRKRTGPGWSNNPYQERQLKFETDSRGGGLLGPVRLLESSD